MIKNVKQFIRNRLEKLQIKKMKRNLKKKLDKLKDTIEPDLNLHYNNLLIDQKKKANYNMIMNSVKSKNSTFVLENAHKGNKKEKKILHPKMVWSSSQGTYRRPKII